MRNYLIEGSYFLASILFILGLRGLSHPETARRGMHLAEFGMLMAIIGTLMHQEIVSYEWILAGLLIGSAIGTGIGLWVPMTAMPQRTAFSHAFGAFAAALVGVSEYSLHGASLSKFTMGALGFDVLLGSLTTTGSLIAFAKLQGMLPGRPLTYKGQNIFNLSLLGVIILAFVVLIFQPGAMLLFYLMLILSLVFGVLLVLPIGSADMPVVIALLNAYAGLASSAIGFAISNNVLIIAGTLDGGSGLILSIVMCRAMNRSITGCCSARSAKCRTQNQAPRWVRCGKSIWKTSQFNWHTPARLSSSPAMEWLPPRLNMRFANSRPRWKKRE